MGMASRWIGVGLGVALFGDGAEDLRAEAQLVEWHAAPVRHRATHPAGPGPGSAWIRCRGAGHRPGGAVRVFDESAGLRSRECRPSFSVRSAGRRPAASGTRRKAGPPPRRSAGVPYFRMSAATAARCAVVVEARRATGCRRPSRSTTQRGSAMRLSAQCTSSSAAATRSEPSPRSMKPTATGRGRPDRRPRVSRTMTLPQAARSSLEGGLASVARAPGHLSAAAAPGGVGAGSRMLRRRPQIGQVACRPEGSGTR